MAARRGAYGPDTLDQARLAALNLAAAEGRKSAGTLGMTPTGASPDPDLSLSVAPGVLNTPEPCRFGVFVFGLGAAHRGSDANQSPLLSSQLSNYRLSCVSSA